MSFEPVSTPQTTTPDPEHHARTGRFWNVFELDRRRACPGAPHTTGRAGPHPAVRSAFPETAVGFGEPLQAEVGPVGVGQGVGEDPGACDPPVSLA